MKEIKLLQMEMSNFRGCSHQVSNFNEGVTTISGKNGLGKSRHADAFMWCLTGKDTLNRKDFEIKTRGVDAETTAKVDASVKLTLVVDGSMVTLKRALVEKWETPKGTTEEVYRGNETKCWWDEVPVSVTEFTKRVSAIIDADTFKLITNPFYFTEILDWKARRAILSKMCKVTNEMAATTSDELISLLAEMNGRSEEDFKKWLSAMIAPLKNKPQELEIRISQIKEDMPEVEDWDSLAEEIATNEERIDIANASLEDMGENNSAYLAKKSELEGEISKYDIEIKELIMSANKKANAEYTEQLRKYNTADAQKQALDFKIKVCKDAIEDYRSQAENCDNVIAFAAEEKTKLAQEYEALKACEGTCPSCGGAMTEELAGKMIPEVVRKIDVQNNTINNATSAKESYLNSIASNEQTIIESEKSIASLSSLEKPIMAVIKEDSIRGMKGLTKALEKARKNLESLKAGVDPAEVESVRKRIEELKAETTNLRVRLANKAKIDEFNERIEELKAESQKIVAERAKYERMQYQFMQLQYVKAQMLQEQVNAMFHNVQFKMFTTTIEGNIIETCIPLINGAYYDSANSASKLNAGLDIINTLSKSYGVSAPIWIDNAEGVNKVAKTKSQQIHLVVTTEDVLNIR